MSRQLMDKRELVEYLNGKMTFDTLGRLVRSGDIPTVKFPNIRRYFFDRSEIDRWVSTLSAQSISKEQSRLRAVK